jgi:hypothetical protein
VVIPEGEVADRRSRLRMAVRRYWSVALAGGLAVTVLVVLIVVGMTSTAAFEPYNPDWDGTNDLRSDAAADPDVTAEIVTDTEQYDAGDPDGTVAFVLTPDEPYTDEDADRVRAFVENGGTIVVLESFDGHGNGLLESTGAEARIGNRYVLDERERDRGPAMPIASELATHSRTADVDRLVLYYATTVEPGDATVLAETSRYSYLGENATDVPDEDDELASYPVATTEAVGEGAVVTISDPSIATNAMYDDPDHARFLANQYADADRVLFDRSHGPDPPPITAAVLAVRTAPALQLLVGLLGIGLAAVATPRVVAVVTETQRPFAAVIESAAAERDERPSDEALIADVRRRHPEWDPEYVRTVITARNRDDGRRRPNDTR